jgi:hypothetical protein
MDASLQFELRKRVNHTRKRAEMHVIAPAQVEHFSLNCVTSIIIGVLRSARILARRGFRTLRLTIAAIRAIG